MNGREINKQTNKQHNQLSLFSSLSFVRPNSVHMGSWATGYRHIVSHFENISQWKKKWKKKKLFCYSVISLIKNSHEILCTTWSTEHWRLLICNQGSYSFIKLKFQDFTRTIFNFSRTENYWGSRLSHINPYHPIIQSTRNSSRNSDMLHRNCTRQATPQVTLRFKNKAALRWNCSMRFR